MLKVKLEVRLTAALCSASVEKGWGSTQTRHLRLAAQRAATKLALGTANTSVLGTNPGVDVELSDCKDLRLQSRSCNQLKSS